MTVSVYLEFMICGRKYEVHITEYIATPIFLITEH